MVDNGMAAAARYLSAVYHDASALELPEAGLRAVVSQIAYVYNEGLGLSIFNFTCRTTFESWRPSHSRGSRHIVLIHTTPNLIWPMSNYGAW